MKELRDRAREALKDGNISGAMELFNAHRKMAPDDQLTLRYLAQLHERRGDHHQAGEVIDRLVELNRCVETLTMQAQNALKRKEYADAMRIAITALEFSSQTNGFSIEAKAIMGDAAFKSGDLEAAHEHFTAVLQSNPENLRGLTGLGTVKLTFNDFPEAFNLFDRASRVNPHHSRALLGKGLTLLGMNKSEEAAEQLSQSLTLEPDNSWALATILPLLSELGQLDKAEQHLREYLARFPDDHPMLLAYAGVAYALGKFTLSREMLDVCLSQAPDYPGAVELDKELHRVMSQQERVSDPVLS